MQVLYFIGIILSTGSLAIGKEISFLKHCLNESSPHVFPPTGERSSESIVMSLEPHSSAWYLPDLNCSVSFQAESGFHLLMVFSNVSLRNSTMDNLTVSFDDQKSELVLAGQQVCSNENCEGLKFDSGDFGNITLRFVTANVTVPSNVTGFRAQFTVFNYVDPRTNACKDKHRYLCENKRCIWYDLVCDGHNNCGDFSDETKCIIPVKNTVWGILVIVVAVIAVLVFVPLFIYLALSGTRSIVKLVHIPSQPTPLEPVDCGETSGLLTASEGAINAWPGTSLDSSNSISYGTAETLKSSAGENKKKTHYSLSKAYDVQENKFL